MGGLDHYVSALKEMVFLPLVYPELFERFKVQPPRGVLFYGPPGTGRRAGVEDLAGLVYVGPLTDVMWYETSNTYISTFQASIPLLQLAPFSHLGKTLVARALASHASKFGKKVSFFMRKGADVLSK